MSEFCAPLTSFDWNEVDPNLIVTSSIDTTCTVWNVTVGYCFKALYDIYSLLFKYFHIIGSLRHVPMIFLIQIIR